MSKLANRWKRVKRKKEKKTFCLSSVLISIITKQLLIYLSDSSLHFAACLSLNHSQYITAAVCHLSDSLPSIRFPPPSSEQRLYSLWNNLWQPTVWNFTKKEKATKNHISDHISRCASFHLSPTWLSDVILLTRIGGQMSPDRLSVHVTNAFACFSTLQCAALRLWKSLLADAFLCT